MANTCIKCLKKHIGVVEVGDIVVEESDCQNCNQKSSEFIGCGKHDKKHPELTRSCGDILFSNKIWICDNCRKKIYTKEQMAIIEDVSLGLGE